MQKIAALACLACAASAAPKPSGEHWVATWAASQQLYRAPGPGRAVTPPPAPPPPPAPAAGRGPARRFGIPPALAGLKNQTVRMIARVSIGGSSVRIRLSNALGAGTVEFGSVHIAAADKDSSVVAGSDRALTFSGKPSATLYAGQTLVSDPVNLELKPLSHVAVSVYVPGEIGPPTNHLFALHTTYLSKEGDFTGKPSIPDAETRESWYWLAGIDVLAPADAGALVTFGDSITDGDQSTPGSDGDWPSVLAERLQANKATFHVGVANAGISGNRVLGDNSSALARMTQDVLSQPGVRWMTVLEGINDITGGSRGLPNVPRITADALIAAYRQTIEAARMRGIKAIGCTLTPYGGSNVFNEYGESVRTAVNQWIRTSGAWDAVVDFDAAVRDAAATPARFRLDVDSPDMLHPANPGYRKMAEAVDLAIFGRSRR